MTRHIAFVFAALLLIAGDSPNGTSTVETDGDVAAMQGGWDLVWGRHNGKLLSDEQMQGTRMLVEQEQFSFPDQTAMAVLTIRGAYRLDADKYPKWIDVIGDDGQVSLGIYHIQNGMRSVCLAPAGKPRPTAFESLPGSQHLLEVWRHKDSAPSDLDKLQGAWKAKSSVVNGESLPDQELSQLRLEIEGNRFRFSGREVLRAGSFTLDPDADPPAITTDIDEGPQAGQQMRGIYKFEGDLQIVCFAEPNGDRPSKFASPTGTGYLLQSWQRLEEAAGQENKLPEPSTLKTKQLISKVDQAAELLARQGKAALAEFHKPHSLWLDGDEYIFVNDMAGILLCHPLMPELEGQNVLHLQDVNGKRFVEMMLGRLSDHPSAWVHYMWPKSEKGKPEWKASYVRRVTDAEGNQYVLGSGRYDMPIEKLFLVDTIQQAAELFSLHGPSCANSLRDPAGPFVYQNLGVWVVDQNGTVLVDSVTPARENTNILDLVDAQGTPFVRKWMALLREQDSCWSEFALPKAENKTTTKRESYQTKVRLGDETFYIGADASFE